MQNNATWNTNNLLLFITEELLSFVLGQIEGDGALTSFTLFLEFFELAFKVSATLHRLIICVKGLDDRFLYSLAPGT